MKLTDKEHPYALTYIVKSFNSKTFWEGVSKEDQNRAKDGSYNINSIESLISWIETHLNKKQKTKLSGSIRQSRNRKINQGKSITISPQAHTILKALAEHDNSTLSEVIETRLLSDYKNRI